MLSAIVLASNGGIALPIARLISVQFPKKTKLSGNDCARVASLIVRERVAVGCTFLQPEIILKLVDMVEQGSSHAIPLYVVLKPLGGFKLGFSFSCALCPSGTFLSHSITWYGCEIAQCKGSWDFCPLSSEGKSETASRNVRILSLVVSKKVIL